MSKTAVSNLVHFVLKQSLGVASQAPSVVILCLLYLSCLSITSLNADDTNKASVFLDGLGLEVTFLRGTHTSVATAECVLTNTTSVPVPYEGTGSNLGFLFKLLDLTGNQIAKKAEWERLNGILDVSKHSAKMIAPKGTLTFSLALVEAFSRPWKPGYRLMIEWNPGDDGKGNPLQTGKGLAVELELKAEQNKTSGTTPEPQETSSPKPVATAQQPTLNKPHESNAPEAKPTPSTQSEELPSSKLWNTIALLTVAVLSLLWQLPKRRS